MKGQVNSNKSNPDFFIKGIISTHSSNFTDKKCFEEAKENFSKQLILQKNEQLRKCNEDYLTNQHDNAQNDKHLINTKRFREEYTNKVLPSQRFV